MTSFYICAILIALPSLTYSYSGYQNYNRHGFKSDPYAMFGNSRYNRGRSPYEEEDLSATTTTTTPAPLTPCEEITEKGVELLKQVLGKEDEGSIEAISSFSKMISGYDVLDEESLKPLACDLMSSKSVRELSDKLISTDLLNTTLTFAYDFAVTHYTGFQMSDMVQSIRNSKDAMKELKRLMPAGVHGKWPGAKKAHRKCPNTMMVVGEMAATLEKLGYMNFDPLGTSMVYGAGVIMKFFPVFKNMPASFPGTPEAFTQEERVAEIKKVYKKGMTVIKCSLGKDWEKTKALVKEYSADLVDLDDAEKMNTLIHQLAQITSLDDMVNFVSYNALQPLLEHYYPMGVKWLKEYEARKLDAQMENPTDVTETDRAILELVDILENSGALDLPIDLNTF